MSLIPGDAILIADVQHNFLLDGPLGSSLPAPARARM